MKKKKTIKIDVCMLMLTLHKNNCMKPLVLFFALWMILLHSAALANIMIDDFSATQFVESSTINFTTGAGILGGERRIETNNYATVSINTSIPNQAVLSSAPGVSYYAYVNLHYDGIGPSNYGLNNLDLTNGGMYSGFQLSVTKIGNSGATFYLTVGQEDQSSSISVSLSHAGTVFLPFTDFEVTPSSAPIMEVDFTNVEYITLYTWVKSNETTVIDSFEVIPEPAMMLLLGTGGLLICRKK